MSKRIQWIDNLKGFSILLVLLGHSFISEDLYRFIYTFHMPLFFAISGYLFKNDSLENTKEYVNKKAKSLLVPYAVFAVLSFPIGLILPNYMNGSVSIVDGLSKLFYLKGSVGWNIPLWFLSSLFFTETLFFILKKYKIENLVIMVLSIIFGYVIYKLNIVLPFGIHISIWALLFYAIGNELKLSNRVTSFKNVSSIEKVITLSILAILNIVFGNFFNINKMEMYHSELGNYWYYIIASVSGMLFMILIFSLLKQKKILQVIGRRTLFILETHMFIILAIRLVDKVLKFNLFNYTNIKGLIIFTITTLIYILAIKILDKYKIKNVIL